ncbi:hypothetical protein DNTS_006306 [Danionella cerebrum]|uniref:Radical S-adenosyl methionine domain-containing protein n=1 Tax=Danionella cerebrum TaxID=2873325 RepID=A0A553QT85_9TELE|nr:hypothetical protein DNTS_006306 [Danionella translucida]
MCSFLIYPRLNLNIFISATSISASCLFLTATVSNPYIIAGLTTVLYTFPLILADTLLSHNTPDTFLHPLQPACTRLFTSFPHSPSHWSIDPKYLNSSTFLTSAPSNLTSRLSTFQVFLHLLSALTTDHNVISKHHCPQRFLSLNTGTNTLSHHTNEASLYIHWPYCLKRCTYCNFNKYIPRGDNSALVTKSLLRETETLLKLSQVSRISSVFFGGGTPSLAHPSTVSAVLEMVSKITALSDKAEVTLEINPTPAAKDALKDFKRAGVNRFSVGVQSLSEDHLRTLGRDHSPQDALRVLAEARSLCPGRVSLDAMFALPGQSVSSWEMELSELLRVCDQHVSLYQLTLERGTQLFKKVQSGELSVPSDDVTALMYQSARRALEEAGFQQYEVSNFAKNSAVSEHNIGYWKGRQYIGVGPGAHGRFVPCAEGGFQREARTQTLEPDVWIREVQSHGHATRRRIKLDHLDLLEEVLVMGLRMSGGISHQHWEFFSPQNDLHQIFGSSADIQELQAAGFLILDDEGLRCSWEGLALLDSLLPTMLLELERFLHHRGFRKTQSK